MFNLLFMFVIAVSSQLPHSAIASLSCLFEVPKSLLFVSWGKSARVDVGIALCTTH